MLAVILGYVLIIVLANRHTVSVNFVFFSTQASLFVVLLLAIALGFAAGWLFDDLRAARRRRKQRDAGLVGATRMRRPRARRAPRPYRSEASSATPSAIRSGVS